MRALRLAGVTGLLALALAPAQAQGAELRAGVGKADITPRTGYYLGGWTRADRVAKGQHTRLHSRALVLQQRRPQDRAGLARPVHGPQRDGAPHRRGAGLARVLRAQHPHLGLAHPLGARRLRELPDLQHGRARAQHRRDPVDHRRAVQPAAGRPPALHVPRPPDRQGDHPRRPRPRPRRGGLGRRRAARADPQPQRRGPPGQPRDRARVRPGQPARTPRARATRSTRAWTCCGWTSSCAAAAAGGASGCRSAAGRTSPTTARSPSPRSSTTTRTTTPRR